MSEARFWRVRFKAIEPVRVSEPTSFAGWVTSDRIAYASSSASFGTCSGAQVSEPTSRPSGSTSSMATVISLPDTPSIAAWWVFVSTAM